MLQPPDNEGKYKLIGKEYTALLRIFATETALVETEGVLKDRLKTIPNAWRDFRMIEKRLGDLSSLILETVPTKKLLMIQREVRNVRVSLKIGPDAGKTTDDQVIYVNENDFIRLLDAVVEMHCFFCTKHGKDVRRCQILKLICDVMPYGPDPEQNPADASCVLAGQTTILEDGGD